MERIARDSWKTFEDADPQPVILQARDGQGMDWGEISYRYRDLTVQIARDRGTVELSMRLKDGDDPTDLYDALRVLADEPKEVRALSLHDAQRVLIDRYEDLLPLIATMAGRAKVQAARAEWVDAVTRWAQGG